MSALNPNHPPPPHPPHLRPRNAATSAIDALYLHLPFCFHKCHYCDFYSVVDAPGAAARRGRKLPRVQRRCPVSAPAAVDRQPAFTRALIAELDAACTAAPAPGLRPRTVFAGGGTPTFLRPGLWDLLLAALHRHGTLERTTEFTVEANPETVTPDLMRRLADGGVNRVSIGAQSFQKASLDALERWHRPESVARAVDACRGAGINNLSLDLIFAIPGQTLAMLDDDLDRLLELEPTHLSTYGLTYEPQTPLTARLRVGRVTPIDEDTERAMYARVLERLEGAGFAHYEVSNWAKRMADSGTADSGWRKADRADAASAPPSPLACVRPIRHPQSAIRHRTTAAPTTSPTGPTPTGAGWVRARPATSTATAGATPRT